QIWEPNAPSAGCNQLVVDFATPITVAPCQLTTLRASWSPSVRCPVGISSGASQDVIAHRTPGRDRNLVAPAQNLEPGHRLSRPSWRRRYVGQFSGSGHRSNVTISCARSNPADGLWFGARAS